MQIKNFGKQKLTRYQILNLDTVSVRPESPDTAESAPATGMNWGEMKKPMLSQFRYGRMEVVGSGRFGGLLGHTFWFEMTCVNARGQLRMYNQQCKVYAMLGLADYFFKTELNSMRRMDDSARGAARRLQLGRIPHYFVTYNHVCVFTGLIKSKDCGCICPISKEDAQAGEDAIHKDGMFKAMTRDGTIEEQYPGWTDAPEDVAPPAAGPVWR